MPVLQHQKIFTYDPVHAREISENYSSEATERGRLFVILETPQHNKINQQPLLDEFINKTANYFDILKQEDSELLLEEILKKINQFLPAMAAESGIKNWLSGLAVIVGIIHQDSIYFSSIGNINALIIHHNQLTSLAERGQPINPNKIFSDIVSGQLEDGDSLIISTDSLFDYISLEKIRQIAKQYTAEAAVKKINNLLEGVPDFVTFNALIIKKPSVSDIDTVVTIKPTVIDDDIEDKTSTIQGTILASDNSARNFRARTPQPKTQLTIDIGVFRKLSFAKKIAYVLRSIGLFFKLVYKILTFITRGLKNTCLFLFSRNYRQSKEAKTLDEISEIGQAKYSWWRQLNKKKKISLVALLIIALVLLQSLVFLTQQRAEQQKDASYDKLLTAVNSKISAADAKLIYNDEAGAEQILVDTQNMLTSAPANSAQQQTQIQSWQEKVWHELNKVRRIHEVPTPIAIADLSAQLTNAQQIVQKNGIFYILDSGKLFSWSKDNFGQLINFENGKFLADWPNQNKLLVGNNDQFFIYNLDSKQLGSSPVPRSSANTSIKGMNVYGNNLYVLDTSNNQLFKYPEKGDSFGAGTPWLKSKIDLAQVSSFAIDGNVYTVDNQGNIKKFLKGQPEPFEYFQPRPAIGPEAVIKTFRDSNYLYIIDPQNKRVIVLDKTGKIKDQFTSPKFDKLTDLAVDLEERAIYLLNGGRLYLLPVNQN